MTNPTDTLAMVRAVSRAAGGGIYLGAGPSSQPVFATSERAVLVLGPPRSGKTTSIVIPAILVSNGPVISTSTKPDVMRCTAGARSRVGPTALYDPSGTIEPPDGVSTLRWSPVSACADWDGAMRIAGLMTSASVSSVARRDDHWHRRAESLLATLLHAASVDGAQMSDVIRWVDRQQSGPAQSILDGAHDTVAADLLCGIAMLDARELSGIWSTASAVLGAYRSNAALDTTRGASFDASEWCETGGTIYICASASSQNLAAPLVVGLIGEVREAAYSRSSRSDRARLEQPLLLALDEVANIAPLPDLPHTVAEGGSNGVITLACLQDLSQARARWGVEAEGFLSLFGSKVVLRGIEDTTTLETVSLLAGDEEVVTRSVSTPDGASRLGGFLGRLAGRAPSSPETVTVSTSRRPRMPADEVSRGADGMALVIDEHSRIGYLRLTPWHRAEPWLSVVAEPLGMQAKGPELGL